MLTRRAFLKRCRDISLLMCGSTLLSRTLAEGFTRLAQDPPALAFIHGQNCLACTTSMIYGNDFEFLDFLTQGGPLELHPALSFSQGGEYLAQLDRLAREGDFLLIVEGSVPSRPRQACYLGDRPLYEVLAGYAARARMVVCSGSCASHGGIPASNRNETGALSLPAYLREQKVEVPLVLVPGCPAHPDHLMGSIAHVVATGEPPPLSERSGLNRDYYGELLHNRCSRFQHFSQDQFVSDFAKDKDSCLLKKGCRGPVTYSDCPVRRWNRRTSVCVESNTPCVGCMNPHWPFMEDLYLEVGEVEDLPWSKMKQKVERRGKGE